MIEALDAWHVALCQPPLWKDMTITVIYGPLLSESVISFKGEQLPKPACSSHPLLFNLAGVEKQPCFIRLGETLKTVWKRVAGKKFG